MAALGVLLPYWGSVAVSGREIILGGSCGHFVRFLSVSGVPVALLGVLVAVLGVPVAVLKFSWPF